MNIIAFHAYIFGDHYMEMMTEQFRKILTSRLYENVDRIYIGVVDSGTGIPAGGVDWIHYFWKFSDKVQIALYAGNKDETETMQWIRNYAINNPNDNVLYFHTKGITHYTIPAEDWRRYMEYFTVENWTDCVQKLNEGYDCCGVMWNSETVWGVFPHFSGTMWWAKCSYINTLNHGYLETDWRLHREFWIGSNPNVKPFEFHNSRMNDMKALQESRSHYSLPYPKENYEKH
jgi:hypothetical protein